ncbi:V-type proton ATPase subunit A [Loa loa]|uniref:V-type proton ATPase subunit a n=1 Tax=Loa loa TaxID=7209 RepID=A0A1S0U7F5_LOALO|nr:V-type proton ATPase subunit A [Loa loa]EFO26436.2 V-type proton ATPase subunit A [Loa loa]
MDSLYRSEEMCLAQLFLQTEAAYTCVAELGELGLVQFRDLNPDVSAFQRKFVNEVRRCDEMERKLRFLEREIKKDLIPMLDTGENPDAPQPKEMIDLEATFEKLENELQEVNQNEEMLKKNFSELTELKHILRKTQQFFEEVEYGRWPYARREENRRHFIPEEEENLLSESRSTTVTLRLGFVAGVIQRERLPAFERLLWRACRGNVFLRHSEIAEPLIDATTGDPVINSVFIIFFQGDQLKTRVKKICEGFRATLYPCPDTPQERREMSIGVMTRIEDLKTVLGQTQDHRHRVLVAASKNVRMWLTKVRKIKSIYHTLNLFNLDVTQKCLIAECWCPVADLNRIQLALKRGTEESGSTVPSILNRMSGITEAPPTFHRVDKFTRGFQNIVDAYGIASYREINPAPYTMITFPFIFAVMFGDCGHGLIMLLCALFFIYREKQLEAARINDEIFQIFFNGRYVIFLMGCFSVYTGFIYNDAYSKSFNLFGSSWRNIYADLNKYEPEKQLMLTPQWAYYNLSVGPYPIGVDPIWNLAEGNKLSFLNSMKMKMSVIIGVAQMTFGIMLSYENYKYFGSRLDILYMFVPQLIFLSCIFIYLCVEILFKWLLFSAKSGHVLGYEYPSSNCAPSLLMGLIKMFMMTSRPSGFVNSEGNVYPQCYLNLWYPGQSFFETLFVLTAAACIPIMLFGKPYMQWKKHKEQSTLGSSNLSVRAESNGDDAHIIHNDLSRSSVMRIEEKFDFGDVMVYQAIHTIEFALGCVSHTASYLRLWALSLAHAQLSDVLWTMVFRQAFMLNGYMGAVATYVLFFLFASLSFSILVLMEGLSAFLHALRLHWVEFQSKFYKGLGYAFIPFSFDKILEEARGAEENM